ncbi:MAG: cytidine deaminase [Pseudomonadota bacterium]
MTYLPPPSDAELIDLAMALVRPRSLSPTAEAGSVGCVLVSGSNALYRGVCIDTACSLGFCAEHTAIGAMITADESRIKTIVAVSHRDGGRVVPPCGRCRELIWQVDTRNRDTRVIAGPNEVVPLSTLLPRHWLDPAE